MDSLIHSQELRSTTLGQALSCRDKAEYDRVSGPFLIQCYQLFISSQPDLLPPTPLHISPHSLSALFIAHCPQFAHYYLYSFVMLQLPKTSSLIHISQFYSSFKSQIKSHFLGECFPHHPTSGPCLLSCGLAVSNVAVIFGTAT